MVEAGIVWPRLVSKIVCSKLGSSVEDIARINSEEIVLFPATIPGGGMTCGCASNY